MRKRKKKRRTRIKTARSRLFWEFPRIWYPGSSGRHDTRHTSKALSTVHMHFFNDNFLQLGLLGLRRYRAWIQNKLAKVLRLGGLRTTFHGDRTSTTLLKY